MAGAMGVFFRLLSFSSILTVIMGSQFVPVIIWQSNGGTPLPVVSAGDRLSEEEFQENVVDKLNVDGPIFVFMQDSLSFEDFSLFGSSRHALASENAFSNVEKLMDSYPSTVLPSVESPSEAISSLAKGRNVVEISNGETSIDDARNKVLVFKLATTQFANDREKALHNNDQIIGKVMNRAKNLFPTFVAFYTGVKSSWANIASENNRVSRHILSAPDNDANYTGVFRSFENCFLFYGKNLTFKITTQSPTDSKSFNFTEASVPLDDFVVDQKGSSCSVNNSALIVMNYAGSEKSVDWLQTISLTLNFTRARTDDWYLTVASLAYKTSNDPNSISVELQTNNVWAPVGFSWNCGVAKFLDSNRTYPRVSLEFNKLQIQAFRVNETFGDAYDCIGFFTAGIWMSIFSSLILMMILAFGITMVMSINTNDRFDDPKGKTITVSATD